MKKPIVFVLILIIVIFYLLNVAAGYVIASKLDEELQISNDVNPALSIAYESITVNPALGQITIHDLEYIESRKGIATERLQIRIPYREIWSMAFRETPLLREASVCFATSRIITPDDFFQQFGMLIPMLGIDVSRLSFQSLCFTFYGIDDEIRFDEIYLNTTPFDLKGSLALTPGNPPQIDEGIMIFTRLSPEYKEILDALEQLTGRPVPRRDSNPYFTFSGDLTSPFFPYLLPDELETEQH